MNWKDIAQARQQYLAIKSQHVDNVLLLRSGDFYEAFDNDARTIATVCGAVLTSRQIAPDVRVPLVGVPYHSIDACCTALMQAVHTVAVAEQVAKAPRGVTVDRVVTQATLLDEVNA
jgi:DNA mismatch repair protein MutS